jgi:hypothetical protein
LKCFIVFLSFLLGVINLLNAKEESQSFVPEGFETVELLPYDFQAMLFVNMDKIGNVEVTYNEQQNRIMFKDINLILGAIKAKFNLVKRESLIMAFKSSLVVCKSFGCTDTKKGISVKVDKKKKLVFIFLGKGFFNTSTTAPVLFTDSTSSLSLIQGIDFSTSGYLGDDINSYNFSFSSVLDRRNASILMNSNLYNSNDVSRYRISRVFGQLIYGGADYQFGFLSSNALGAIMTENYFGFKYETNYASFENLKYFSGTPISISVLERSSIRVYQNNLGGVLLYSQSLSPGTHTINTNSFPSGSYNVKVIIEGVNGSTRNENFFYTKNLFLLPPYNMPNLSFGFGLTEKNNGYFYSSKILPPLGKSLFANINYTFRLNSTSALGLSLVDVDDVFIFSNEYIKIWEDVSLDASISLTSKKEVSWAVSGNFDFDVFTLNSQIRQVINVDPNLKSTFGVNKATLNNNISADLGTINFSLNSNFARLNNNNLNKSLLFQATRAFSFFDIFTNISASVGYSDNIGHSAMLSINLSSYVSDDINLMASSNYQMNKNLTVPRAELGVSYSMDSATDLSYNFSVDPDNRLSYLNFYTYQDYLTVSSSFTHDHINDSFGENTNYNINLSTNMLISKNGVIFESGVSNTGLIIKGYMDNTSKQDKYSVLINGVKRPGYIFNRSYFLPLGSYNNFKIEIDHDEGLWHLDGNHFHRFTTLNRDIYTMSFKAYKKFLVILDIQDNDIENHVITIEGYPNYQIGTDGYVQLGLNSNIKLLTGIRKNGQECIIDLSNSDFEKSSIVRDYKFIPCV